MKRRPFLSVVPRAAQLWALALPCFGVVIGSVIGYWVGSPGAPVRSALAHGAAGLAVGVVFALWALSLGFVYADARDRNMPPVLWTLVALLVPNLLGYLLYFAIRKPLPVACLACKHAVAVDQPFCSWCGSSQQRSLSAT